MKEKVLDKLGKAYEKGQPIVSDTDYDAIAEVIGKPNTVWESKGDTRHKIFMGKIAKTNDDKVIELRFNDPDYIAQPKFDGISAEVVYRNGEIVQVTTRGDGLYGMDITKHFKKCTHDPRPYSMWSGIVRGELVISYREMAHFPEYKNPRNAVAGLYNRKAVSHKLEHTTFLPYDKIHENGYIYTLDYMELSSLKMIHQVIKDRHWANFPIDGIVFKERGNIRYNDQGIRENCIAYKEEQQADSAWSFIKEIEWDVSRHGKLSPVAIIQPVDVDGVTVSRVTLNSAKFIETNKITLDSLVCIQRGGGVIPEILSVYNDEDEYIPYVLPQECPHCDNFVHRKGANLFCGNDFCIGKVKSYIEYAAKSVLNIKNVGKDSLYNSFISAVRINRYNILELGKGNIYVMINIYLKEAFNITTLTRAQAILLANIEGIGSGTATKIADDTSALTLYKFIQYVIDNHIVGNSVIFRGIFAIYGTKIATPCQTTHNKTIVITGTLPLERDKVIVKLDKLGIKVNASVSYKVDELLVGVEPGKTKIEKATKYQIPITIVDNADTFGDWLEANKINPDDFFDINPSVDYVDI